MACESNIAELYVSGPILDYVLVMMNFYHNYQFQKTKNQKEKSNISNFRKTIGGSWKKKKSNTKWDKTEYSTRQVEWVASKKERID